MRRKLNKTVYGRDSYRGRSGPEYDEPGDGFAPNRGYEGSGYQLKPFRGEHLDKLSIQEILDIERGEEAARQAEATQELLSELGFGTDGSTLQ